MRIFIVLVLCVLSSASFSQDYTTAVGLRGGIGSGITIKHNIGGDNFLEGLVYWRKDVVNLTGLYERYMPLPQDNLYWFFGGGAHIGSYGYVENEVRKSSTTIGADFIVGIEYVFAELPLNLSLDWKPEFNFIGRSGTAFDGIALSARYYW